MEVVLLVGNGSGSCAGGRRWLPCSWNWSEAGARTEVGGGHQEGAGGFSGGGSDGNPKKGENGLGGGITTKTEAQASGGGYYSGGTGYSVTHKGFGKIGGQSGGPCSAATGSIYWYKDYFGCGGESGAGGEIYYSNKDNVFAFNGNMITNGDYNSAYYEYNKDGTQINENKLNVVTKKNGNKIIPTKIFAQSGVIRATYTSNQGKYTLDKVTRKLDVGEVLPNIAKSYSECELVKATNETETAVTGYTNPLTPELKNQGIGSRSSGI